MSVSQRPIERLKPVQSFQTRLENLSMPITVLFFYQLIFAILNGIDQVTDDNNDLTTGDRNIGLTDSTGFILMAVIVAFWVGVTAIQEGGTVGDALLAGMFVGLGHGLLSATSAELFSEKILRGDLSTEMIQYIISWMGLFTLVSMTGAGLAEDWLFETKPRPVKIEKPKVIKPEKKLKKTVKKTVTVKKTAVKKPVKKKTTMKAKAVVEEEDDLE